MLDSVMGAAPAVRRLQSIGARGLFALGLDANRATVLGAAIGLGAAFAFGAGRIGWGIFALAASAGLDALDGTIARECGAPSAFGGVLDLCSDRLVEIAVIIGIAWRRPELYFAALVLVGSWYVNITVFLAVGAALEHRGPKLIVYPPGILERSEALIFFAVLALVERASVLRALGPWLCYLMTALEIATGAQRLRFGYRMLEQGKESER
jgi:archaetidylinositol phosphate synthase